MDIEDLSEVKDLMIDTGIEIEEAEDDDDDFDDDDEVFVEESEEAIEEKEEEHLQEYAEDHPNWVEPTENPLQQDGAGGLAEKASSMNPF